MGTPELKKETYSAKVEIYLTINEQVLQVWQLGPDFMIMKNNESMPPSTGEVTLCVDNRIDRWVVDLPYGIQPGVARTVFVHTAASKSATPSAA